MNLLDEAVTLVRKLEKSVTRDKWYWANLSRLTRVTLLANTPAAMHDAVTRAANAAVTSRRRGPCNWAEQEQRVQSRIAAIKRQESMAKKAKKREASLMAAMQAKQPAVPTSMKMAFSALARKPVGSITVVRAFV